IFIISRKTGKIVWKVGPDYSDAPELKKLGLNLKGWGGGFVGGMLHNAHMIPKGLPGEGNILVFNNGRPYSLVTEFDPVTRKVVWEYSGEAIGYGPSHSMAHKFFSPTISGMQRLPNGNTLICEGDGGRLFEVTTRLEIVWEYINPNNEYRWRPGWKLTNNVYRAYRVPFEWVPQLKKPEAKPVTPPDNSEFKIDPEHGIY
ncbi:MAG: thioredoxin, partial [Deltaproteobacteria bacterium]|nr:thioredoxin [Deltaproteobacteria bacterium]